MIYARVVEGDPLIVERISCADMPIFEDKPLDESLDHS